MTDLQRLEKWEKWLKRIKLEVQNLVLYRSAYKEVIEIINSNESLHEDNFYYRYMNDSHIAYIVMGIRRQIKNDNQSISIVRLLTEISKTPHLITRNNYVDHYSDSVISDFADDHFDQFCKNPGDIHLSEDMVIEDIDKLKVSSILVEKYADRFIAHSDNRGIESLPTFNDIDSCLEILDKIYCKYHLIFYASSMDSLFPTVQYHWKKIFELPWIINEQ